MAELNDKPPAVSENGFSLIELLIAVAILGAAIIGIVALLPQGYSHIGTAGRISTMNHMGQQKLDQLRNLSYNDVYLLDGVHPSTGPERPIYLDADGTNIYADYSIKWEVQEDLPQADMKTVVVEVGHQLYDHLGNPIPFEDVLHQRVIRFQTYISK